MLRFTGDIWKNHPCCVVCMNEHQVAAKPEWTQAVMNAVVRAQVTAQEDKKEVARMLSRDGKRYLPMPAKVVERAMTLYDDETYASPDAIRHAEWGVGRIDFQPWPYPSATKLIVNAMNDTLVSGDKSFLGGLDPEFVARDLVNYDFVRTAMEKHRGWETAPGVDPENPFEREEVIVL
jgi:NitT/TauT family transport system substrate-binding protein